ncbi:MAG: DNA mismatch repair protein MutS [Flavobacteriales bacterium]
MPEAIYLSNIEVLSTLIEEQKKKLSGIMISRILAFFVLMGVVGLTIYLSNLVVLWGTLLPLIVFGYLVKLNAREKTHLAILRIKKEINEKEIACIQGDYSNFGNGNEFINSQHNYSHDIDLFGKKSLFQHLNRTTSRSSEKKLAKILLNFETDAIEIENRQQATKEIAIKLEWRQQFAANGINYSTKENEIEQLLNWNADEIPIFEKILIWKLILGLVPAVIFGAILLAYYSVIPISVLIFIFFIPLLITGRHIKLVNEQHKKIGSYLAVLAQHQHLANCIEEEEFESVKLKVLKAKLTNNQKSASNEIGKLNKITEQIDNRSNPIFAILMNILVLWDLNYLFKLKEWLLQNSEDIKSWFDAVHEMETITSLGNFHYNNPLNIFPQLGKDTIISAKDLAHPLLKTDARIANDFDIDDLQKFTIITGANMAGKSTFLRAVGTNLILAMAGSSVCASAFRFTPLPLFSSMRTSDSLSENESYFYSELKRLQLIVNKLKDGQQLFIILDEILKGTNSKDKAEGSKSFVQQLIKYKTAGIIATHDLSLCSLKDDFPSQIDNSYFDVEIENDELIFDYKLKSGICSNMNAQFLMKKMGITN